MKRNKRSSKVTQELFDKIKKMQELDIQAAKVSKILGLSNVTIGKVFKATDLDDYKHLANARLIRKEKVTNNDFHVSIVDTDISVDVPSLLRKIAKYLENNVHTTKKLVKEAKTK